jgi:hypothetical protein
MVTTCDAPHVAYTNILFFMCFLKYVSKVNNILKIYLVSSMIFQFLSFGGYKTSGCYEMWINVRQVHVLLLIFTLYKKCVKCHIT